jgi:hypothetical protein
MGVKHQAATLPHCTDEVVPVVLTCLCWFLWADRVASDHCLFVKHCSVIFLVTHLGHLVPSKLFVFPDFSAKNHMKWLNAQFWSEEPPPVMVAPSSIMHELLLSCIAQLENRKISASANCFSNKVAKISVVRSKFELLNCSMLCEPQLKKAKQPTPSSNLQHHLLCHICNMRTSKKRRKKQSRVIPAGDSHVNQ